MAYPLLLDEVFSASIAERLSTHGHDVRAVVADQSLISLPDEQILSLATAQDRAVVTANIKDFVPLDALYRSTGRTHAGIVLVPSRTFPQDRSLVGAIVDSLARLLKESGGIGRDQVVFLRR